MEQLNFITAIKEYLIATFSEIDLWFEKEEEVRQFRPPSNGWTIDEILEHIALTNHFLLILIDKGKNKALQNRSKLVLEEELKTYTFNGNKLTEVGLHESFTWIRPAHMEPKGEKTLIEVKEELQLQLKQCLASLDELKNGEGILYKTTMSVNNLGKIDVYEYIYFLAQHGKRHITQMTKNELAYNKNKKITI